MSSWNHGPYRSALRDLRGPFFAVLAFSAIINTLMLTGSIYMLQVYDRVLTSGSVPTLLALFTIVAVLFGFLFVYDVIRRRVLSRGAMRLDRTVGGGAFELWLSSGLPEAAGVRGDPRPLRDLDSVRGFLAGPAVTALFDLPFVPIFLLVLFLLHPWLGMLTVGGAVISAALALLSRWMTSAAIRRATEAEAVERDFSSAGRQAAETIHAMGMGEAVRRRWSALHDRMLTHNQSSSDPAELLASASRTFRMFLQSGILTLGAYLVISGEISGGMIVASSILSGRALAPLDQVIGQWRAVGRAWQAHQRLSDVLGSETDEEAPVDLPQPEGRLDVAGLTKLLPGRAGDERPPILNDVSFSLEPGDGLGVIGASGSGKSTLGRMLTGAWNSDAGEVRLDGATLSQWDPACLGNIIGYLPQRTEMLPGTIRDNICRFDPAATDEAVIAAARMGGLHEMILRLPDGYATRIGNTGDVILSGGQMQRIGLARALYNRPKLVVLDEPNSNLDAAGDAALTEAIRTLRAAGSVVVVMAHRPSALAAVNKILILERGNAVRFGDREEVLNRIGRPVGKDDAKVAKRRLPLTVVPAGPVSDAPVSQIDSDQPSASERLRRLTETGRQLKRERAQ